MNDRPLRLAVFLSGGGRTLANLLEHQDQHALPIDIQLVISSRSDVRGVTIAQSAGIETLVVRKRDFACAEDHCNAMFDPCRNAGVDYVVMAGYLNHVLIPEDFSGRVINIHPSLLPAFGGSGMYGHHVHQAVLDRGVQVTGCTVHFVDNQYDNGPILLQRWCEVQDNDTADTLAARVFQQECEALPAAIKKLWAMRP